MTLMNLRGKAVRYSIMGKRRDALRNALYEVYKHSESLLDENEIILNYGYATRTGWAGPRRCFIALTDKRIVVVWLRNKYSIFEEVQTIYFDSINQFTYRLGLALYAPINQKPFIPRLYIERNDKEVFAFAFDDQNIARAIFNELDMRMMLLSSNPGP